MAPVVATPTPAPLGPIKGQTLEESRALAPSAAPSGAAAGRCGRAPWSRRAASTRRSGRGRSGCPPAPTAPILQLRRPQRRLAADPGRPAGRRLVDRGSAGRRAVRRHRDRRPRRLPPARPRRAGGDAEGAHRPARHALGHQAQRHLPDQLDDEHPAGEARGGHRRLRAGPPAPAGADHLRRGVQPQDPPLHREHHRGRRPGAPRPGLEPVRGASRPAPRPRRLGPWHEPPTDRPRRPRSSACGCATPSAAGCGSPATATSSGPSSGRCGGPASRWRTPPGSPRTRRSRTRTPPPPVRPARPSTWRSRSPAAATRSSCAGPSTRRCRTGSTWWTPSRPAPAPSRTGSRPRCGGWSCRTSPPSDLRAALAAFLAREQVEVQRMTKSGLRTFDARGAVVRADVLDGPARPLGDDGGGPEPVVRHESSPVSPCAILRWSSGTPHRPFDPTTSSPLSARWLTSRRRHPLW